MEKPIIFFGDIRNYAIQHLNGSGKNPMDFYDIYRRLSASGGAAPGPKALKERPESEPQGLPDFMSWDTKDTAAFSDLIDRIPVIDSTVFPLSPEKNGHEKILYVEPVRPFFISREIPYIHTRPHIDDCFVFLYVYEGSCVVELEGTSYTMEAGELCLISPRVTRRHFLTENDFVLCIMVEKGRFEKDFFALLRYDNFLSEFFRQALVKNEKGHLFFMIPPDTGICQIFQRLFQEVVRTDPYSDTMFGLCLNLLFTQILRSQKDTYQHFSQNDKPTVLVALPYILQYIQENYADLTLETLADAFHYEKGYLSKMIHRFTGKTYTQIVGHYKLEQAADLLTHTDMRISDIAQRSGFGSSDHFTRSFRKYAGTTPRQFRKCHPRPGKSLTDR